MKAIRVTAAILIENNKIFIAQRSLSDQLSGKWEFPGGKIEAHESAEECLSRELFEEFTIETKVGDFLGESIYDYGDKVVHLLAYFVSRVSGKIKASVHQDFKWVEKTDLNTIDWAPADIPLVNQLLDKLNH